MNTNNSILLKTTLLFTIPLIQKMVIEFLAPPDREPPRDIILVLSLVPDRELNITGDILSFHIMDRF